MKVFVLFVVLCLTAVCIAYMESVHINLTSDNFLEFYDSIPNRISELFALAEVEPKVLHPCDTTVWIIGDTAVIFWQGASVLGQLCYTAPTDTPLDDSAYYVFHIPYWNFRIEIYKNGDFIDNIFPSTSEQHFPLNDLNDPRTINFCGGKPRPRLDISEHLDQLIPGIGYQIRIISWNRFSDSEGYIEIWSDPFEIAEPWLEIVIPDSSTIWREDSSDVFIRFNRHGSFGRLYPEGISPSIYLIRYGDLVARIGSYYSFYNGELEDIKRVNQEWGNGDGYQICLELRDGNNFYSDYFSIYGQTIDVTVHANNTFQSQPQWSHYDSDFAFEWSPSSGVTICVELYKMGRDGFDFVAELVPNISNEGYYIYEGPPNRDWGNGLYRLKVIDSVGNYGWSEDFYIFLSITIP